MKEYKWNTVKIYLAYKYKNSSQRAKCTKHNVSQIGTKIKYHRMMGNGFSLDGMESEKD